MAFVMKKVKQPLNEDFLEASYAGEVTLEDCSVNIEEVGVESGTHNKECTWEYHILYSTSYATPILYFNAFTQDGRLLPLETFWKGLQSGTRETLQQMRLKALSQQEHPISRRPFFQLHPCKTAEFLDSHQGYSSNPVVTWLSSIGPAVGLDLNIAYSRLVQQKKT